LREQDVIGEYAPDIALKNDLMRTLLQPLNDNRDLNIYADNKECYFSRDIQDVTSNNEVIGHVIVLRNVTVFHQMNEARTNFIVNLSHQLKAPIASIKEDTQRLMDQGKAPASEDREHIIRKINEETDRLLKITAELVNVTQAEQHL